MNKPENYDDLEDEFVKKDRENIKRLTQRYEDKVYELSIEDAVSILRDLEGLGFAPTTEGGWIATAKHFIRIVGTKERGEFLAQYIGATCQRFPKPIEMRWIYSRHYTPADGIEPREIDASDELKLPGTKNDEN